jgi:hypothetical protein
MLAMTLTLSASLILFAGCRSNLGGPAQYEETTDYGTVHSAPKTVNPGSRPPVPSEPLPPR